MTIAEYHRLYRGLEVPDPAALPGVYLGEFVGPWWLRRAAAPAIGLAGMPGWIGKEVLSAGEAVNLVRQGGEVRRVLPMRIGAIRSFVDRGAALAFFNQPDAPVPWRFVLDEFRAIDGSTLLAMTVIRAPGLDRLPLPFLLHRQ